MAVAAELSDPVADHAAFLVGIPPPDHRHALDGGISRSFLVTGARGHSQIVGTPAQIADEMEEHFQA